MVIAKLQRITAAQVKDWYNWLKSRDAGCCSIHFASTVKWRYCVCMGWHDFDENGRYDDRGMRIAWKIGRQSHDNIMQCDFDVDFDIPYDPETGMCDHAPQLIEVEPGAKAPAGYRSWAELAKEIRAGARRVFKRWKRIENADSPDYRGRLGRPESTNEMNDWIMKHFENKK